MIGSSFSKFSIAQGAPRKGKHQLWRLLKKVGGKLNLTPQPAGDCVSAGARNVLDILQAVEIVNGDRESWKPIFSPFHYATGRVLVGKNKIRGDGSLGSWQAQAIKLYGSIPYDLPGVPEYTKDTVQKWGSDQSESKHQTSFRKFLEAGKEHVCKDAARIMTIEEMGDAIQNGHPWTIAAQFGYQMQPNSQGFHVPNPQDPWGHQVSGFGVDWEREYFEVPNQWGDVHGHLFDFDDNEPLPLGVMRIKFSDMRKHVQAGGEMYAYSGYEGFPAQTFDHAEWA